MARKNKNAKSTPKKVLIEEADMMAKTSKSPAKLSKKLFLYVVILLIIVGGLYFGKKLFFAASVNGQLVSRLTVINELEKKVGQKTLDDLILRTLINQEGKKRGINIPDEEIKTEISKIEKNITSQGTTLDELLKQQGMTKSDLTVGIKLQLLVTKMAGSDISVTDKEIADYLAGQKAQSSSISDQTVPEMTKDQAKEVIKQQKLQAKIQTFVSDLKAKAKINYFIKY